MSAQIYRTQTIPLLNFIESRSMGETPNLASIEDLLKRSLPPLFRLFLHTYLPESYQRRISQEECVEVRGKADLVRLWRYAYHHVFAGNVILELFDEQKILQGRAQPIYFPNVGDIRSQYISIGDYSSDSLLLLGIGDNNLDQVYIGYRSPNYPNTEGVFYLADNIFDFVRFCYLEAVYYTNLNKQGVDERNLYKNWGEKIWRISEEMENA